MLVSKSFGLVVESTASSWDAPSPIVNARRAAQVVAKSHPRPHAQSMHRDREPSQRTPAEDDRSCIKDTYSLFL
jgi:hypothetical protein